MNNQEMQTSFFYRIKNGEKVLIISPDYVVMPTSEYERLTKKFPHNLDHILIEESLTEKEFFEMIKQ